MRGFFGLVGILLVVGIGFLVYSHQIQSDPDAPPLPQQIDLADVRTDLLSIGQAERLYFATNGHYATLEELQNSGVVSVVPTGSRWSYTYMIETVGSDNFRITARPKDLGQDLPIFTMDKTMQVSR
ncbi:MAG: type IV pilin protein [Acidobacteriota bacterium]